MPIEIKELVIVSTIGSNNGETGSAQGNIRTPQSGANNMDAIVSKCVDQVLYILKNKEER